LIQTIGVIEFEAEKDFATSGKMQEEVGKRWAELLLTKKRVR
jgi:hypothetical protein